MLAAEAVADLVVVVAVAVPIAIIVAVTDGIVLMAVAAYGVVVTVEHREILEVSKEYEKIGINNSCLLDASQLHFWMLVRR